MDEQELRAMIMAEIAEQQRLQNHCFRASERFRWCAMATGVVATLAVALLGGVPGSQWLAVLPGLSSFFVGTERTFAFRQRSGWHCDKRLGLEHILLALDEGSEVADVRRQLLALDAKMSGAFPHGALPDATVMDRRA